MLVQKDKYIYSSRGGQTLMEDIEAMKRQLNRIPHLLARIEDQERRIENQERRIEDQERRIVTLEEQVGLLTLNSKSYSCTRQSFLDVSKRDYKGSYALQGSRATRDGNMKAHKGDALADASLFSRNNRSDIDLYRKLYGLEYKQVLEIHGIYEHLKLVYHELIN